MSNDKEIAHQGVQCGTVGGDGEKRGTQASTTKREDKQKVGKAVLGSREL